MQRISRLYPHIKIPLFSYKQEYPIHCQGLGLPLLHPVGAEISRAQTWVDDGKDVLNYNMGLCVAKS